MHDFGDVDGIDVPLERSAGAISSHVRDALQAVDALVLLGGNNGVTRPAFLGLPAATEQAGLLTLDAHLDLRDLQSGLNNGNPIRALLKDGLAGNRIVQIGIQSFANSSAYARVAREAGIAVVTVVEIHRRGIEAVVTESLARLACECSAIYVDLDLDVLDRVFAPATAGSRPGGLSPADVHQAARLCGAHPKVRVIDLVEMDPQLDIADVTALNAALCLLSFAAGFRTRSLGG